MPERPFWGKDQRERGCWLVRDTGGKSGRPLMGSDARETNEGAPLGVMVPSGGRAMMRQEKPPLFCERYRFDGVQIERQGSV